MFKPYVFSHNKLINIKKKIDINNLPNFAVKVSCGNGSLIIQLDTQEPFTGRLYASGYSETCDIQGTGSNTTLLALRIPDEKELDKGNIDCGITPAYAVENDNQYVTYHG